ncbi:FecR family protein [Bradyrhizobium sp.]|uniref:FecR family protein n=1 Tax=Bradyrhizobium sp. TaxID=376 RepID=UPI0025BE8A43|nr:FecR family protein [Bradyrhizobium sp.]
MGAAHAQKRVGEAVVVQKQVLRVAGSAANQINVGEAMMRDDTVQTGIESAARFVMADSTNLSLGPNASLTLDSTVFNDDHSYRDVAIRMTTGAFRFVTGHSEKTAYKISTPLATIGVRGTILDILTVRNSTTVVLQEGGSKVCAPDGQCLELINPGDTAIITLGDNGKFKIKKANIPPWTFAKTCASTAGLCSVNKYADDSPTVTPDVQDGGMLCGR